MVKLYTEASVHRAFDDQKMLLFFSDGSAVSPQLGDADVDRILCDVTMDLAVTKARTERDERVDGWIGEYQSRNRLVGRAVVI